jgi:hypothetical protein
VNQLKPLTRAFEQHGARGRPHWQQPPMSESEQADVSWQVRPLQQSTSWKHVCVAAAQTHTPFVHAMPAHRTGLLQGSPVGVNPQKRAAGPLVRQTLLQQSALVEQAASTARQQIAFSQYPLWHAVAEVQLSPKDPPPQ